MSAYPSVTFPPPPPTANTLSSQQRAALVRSSRKLSKVLGHVPRMLDSDVPPLPSASSAPTATPRSETGSMWQRRKPTHLPPLLKFSGAPLDAPDSPLELTSPVYHHPPAHRGSVLSVAPSIVSNAPSTASGSSVSSDASQRRTKLERLRRRLGDDVPATAVFPTTPHTAVPLPAPPPTAKSAKTSPRPRSRSRTRSQSRPRSVARQSDDARSVAFSISSDERVHAVTLTAAHVHSPRPHKTKHMYQTGPLPPVPRIPAHLTSAGGASSRAVHGDADDAGLVRSRQKVAAGSRIGGSDFKASRRAKREGRALNGMAEPGELVEMVGFLRF